MIPKVKTICAFWDFNLNEWSTKGCRVLKPLEEKNHCGAMTVVQNRSQRVTCTCDHMTHFSMILVSTSADLIVVNTNVNYPKWFTLRVSQIFMSTSTISTWKKLRRDSTLDAELLSIFMMQGWINISNIYIYLLRTINFLNAEMNTSVGCKAQQRKAYANCSKLRFVFF